MRIRPAEREQRPVPSTNRLRPHEHTDLSIARKHPGQCGQEHPIGRTTTWPRDLPAKHREFVTQDKDLDLVRGL
jgi:hypothetical protein